MPWATHRSCARSRSVFFSSKKCVHSLAVPERICAYQVGSVVLALCLRLGPSERPHAFEARAVLAAATTPASVFGEGKMHFLIFYHYFWLDGTRGRIFFRAVVTRIVSSRWPRQSPSSLYRESRFTRETTKKDLLALGYLALFRETKKNEPLALRFPGAVRCRRGPRAPEQRNADETGVPSTASKRNYSPRSPPNCAASRKKARNFLV